VSNVMKGTVVRCASQKTSVVRVDRMKTHPVYGKKSRVSKNYLSHDANGQCKVGDKVTIKKSRTFSKKKHFEIVHVQGQEI
jgi:small subunit ribosomal protein S17